MRALFIAFISLVLLLTLVFFGVFTNRRAFLGLNVYIVKGNECFFMPIGTLQGHLDGKTM